MVGAVGNLCYAFLAVLSFTLDTAFLRFRLAPADGERSPFLRAAGRKYEGWLFAVLCVVPRGEYSPKRKERRGQTAQQNTNEKEGSQNEKVCKSDFSAYPLHGAGYHRVRGGEQNLSQ